MDKDNIIALFTVISILYHVIVHIAGHTVLEEYNCGQADIQYNVTLKGGTMAGSFRNHGPAKNIQECIHSCCMAKKCDVAMMVSNRCYGVHCYNSTMCETVPAVGKAADQDMQIAHVTPKGSVDIDKLDPKDKEKFDLDAKCPHNEVMYNVKLRGGLLAGKFTDIGKVRSIKTCIRYCCQTQKKCDLAFLLKDRCYLVKCYNEERCQALPSPSVDFNFEQKMAFVAPWLYKKNRKLVTFPSGQSPHHIQCTQSKVYNNVKISGGSKAGDFTDVGKVGRMHICTRLCCEEPVCDLAYMVRQSCFLVKCADEKKCRVIGAGIKDKEHINKTTDTSIQYIVKRKYNVQFGKDGVPMTTKEKKQQMRCSVKGRVQKNAVLRAGMISGDLTPHPGIKRIKPCVKKCCQDMKCEVAVMLEHKCYTVRCINKDYCQSRPAPPSAYSKKPMLAFVTRKNLYKDPYEVHHHIDNKNNIDEDIDDDDDSDDNDDQDDDDLKHATNT